MLANKVLSAIAGQEEKLYVDDVFVPWLRTGTGADATVTTGIDMTKGYMLWSKGRSGATDHAIYDSVRGVTFDLVSNSTAAQTTQATGLKAVSSTGHTVGSLAKMNTSGATYVDWVFRRAPKFFDCGTYTGNGVAGRQIPHSLGVAPGMVIVKNCTTAGYSWFVWHRGLSVGNYIVLEQTSAQTNSSAAFIFGNNTTTIDPTASVFTVGSAGGLNENGATIVWYAFAHDTSTDGIIQCGSFTTDGSGNATVNLGWEPQYIVWKATNTAQSWGIMDSARGFVAPPATTSAYLAANSSIAEAAYGAAQGPNATGFTAGGLGASNTFIYLAIRHPNKPPTTGTQVYNAIARTGTGAAATVTGVGFAPDAVFIKNQSSSSRGHNWFDRLRGTTNYLQPFSTNSENGYGTQDESLKQFLMDGITLGSDSTGLGVNQSGTGSYINHFFKRAPGVFETLCYTGSGSNKTESHGLSVAPELWLIKKRSATGNWVFGSSLLSSTEKIIMPSPNGRVTDSTVWNSTLPASSVISLGTSTDVNASTSTYVGYLWASKPGVSKVFTYTGNGLIQTINCGFSTGARFVMIIRATASTSQDIFVWDSVRGIVSGNDPRLSLNTTAAEVTTLDSIDPDVTGFIVNTDATNINVNGAVYIGLAYA